MAYTTIDNPELFFQTKLYTGDGSTSLAITFDGSENMQPDLIWIKARTGSYNHNLFDVVRGSKYWLGSNTNSAEDTGSGYPNSFDSDGFTLNNGGSTNNSGTTFASWNWKAGTSFTNDASATSIGSIDSTGSANDTAGFSIVTWTGTGSAGTIKHGLSTTPSVIITFARSTGYHHSTFHHKNTSAPETDVVYLNLTNATADDSGFWNDTLPTTSVFSVGDDNSVNQSSVTYVAYCFSERQGYFKAGVYEGNANADGPFSFTGFRPAWVITKAIDTTSNWQIWDNKRSPFNTVDDYIKANATAGEDTGSSDVRMDFLSNGFKLRGNNDVVNGNETYIYMACAESPLVNSNGIPNNAR